MIMHCIYPSCLFSLLETGTVGSSMFLFSFFHYLITSEEYWAVLYTISQFGNDISHPTHPVIGFKLCIFGMNLRVEAQ